MNLKCNQLNDCSDGSDEIGCQNNTVPSTTSTPTTTACSGYRCDNGKCVSLSYVCDRDNDCGDLSDERNCPPCRRPLFSCENRNCLIQDHVCDGDDDCGDGTDERNCPSRVDVTTRAPTTRKMENTFCSGRLLCSNGRCLRKSDICDGDNDCGDYSDEADCGRPNACRKGVEFQCSQTFKCVPYLQRCDHVDDCGDNSDEIGCQHAWWKSNYSSNWFLHGLNKQTFESAIAFCESNGASLPVVVSLEEQQWLLTSISKGRPFWLFLKKDQVSDHVCDGDDDCGDGTDERNCPSRVDMTTGAPTTGKMENTFCYGRLRCSDGKCLKNSDICDGANDCGDYSDEADCGRPNACRKGVDFQCAHTLKCVPYLQICDYVDDCGDNSDETGCEHALRKSNYSSNWFFHGQNKQTFESAIAYCESNGASLPVVASLEEQQWLLTSITKGRPFWLFLKKDQVSGEFSHWGNGEKVKFTNWQANREANSSQCTAISVSRMGKWLECSCHSWQDAYVICMRDRPLVAQDSIASTSDDNSSGNGWLVPAAILCTVLLALIIYVICEIKGLRASVKTQIVTDVETNIEMKADPDEETYYSSPSEMINYYASGH
ncbi:Low-density lipoprotein receptor-related protein 1B [Halotydeus destructor]|nr:Low-density lipoprotein receptor-related protein 1B [Halotydeus destructor]